MKKNNILEILCFILFCIGTIIISCFHEPWFDEFQAWGISKDSIYNILFVIPHLEGHPPLWHLILKCFSYFNVNCELGIKIPNLLFMFGAVWLLIFKSPFPRIVRLTLPFTYFIFYQYSIVSRPYSMFCFAIFLAALFYKERNNHPFKFVSALALLCISSAYGMVISAGIILVWFIQILSGGGIVEVIKTFIKDKRFYAMFLIFLLCLGLFFIIYPNKDNIAISPLKDIPLHIRLLYCLFILPADALITDFLNYMVKKTFTFNILGCFIGLLINILFFYFLKINKKLLLFYIPYLMILCIAFFLHFHVHHIALITIFYIFIFWTVLTERKEIKMPLLINKSFITFFIVIIIVVQIYWTICASINDIKYLYYPARNIAQFLKDNKLENYKIMSSWVSYSFYINKKTKERIYKEIEFTQDVYNEFIKYFDEKKVVNFNFQTEVTGIIAYFNRNIVYSFNVNNPQKQYAFSRDMDEDEVLDIKQKLKKEGLPDILLCNRELTKLDEIFEEKELADVEYILLKEFYYGLIWKDKQSKSIHKIYMRKDLYDKLYNIENVNY